MQAPRGIQIMEIGFVFIKGKIEMATTITKEPKKELFPKDAILKPKVSYKGEQLTDAQVSILNMIGEAKSNKEIAAALSISIRTVESHLARVRNMILNLDGARPKERELVLFAKEMRDGYKVFTKIKKEQKSNQSSFYDREIELIEDWDETILESNQDASGNNIVGLDQFRPEYEITDFQTVEQEIQFTSGKYYLV